MPGPPTAHLRVNCWVGRGGGSWKRRACPDARRPRGEHGEGGVSFGNASSVEEAATTDEKAEGPDEGADCAGEEGSRHGKRDGSAKSQLNRDAVEFMPPPARYTDDCNELGSDAVVPLWHGRAP